MKRNRVTRLAALLLAFGLLLTACGGQKPAEPAKEAPKPAAPQPAAPKVEMPKRLSIVTGGTSGVYYVYGGALAKVLSKGMSGTEVTAEVTAASVENLNLLNKKEADIAFTLADTLNDAVNGKGKFKEKLPLKSIGVLYGNMTHIVALADSGINSVKDLKGKKVSTGSPNSGTEVIAERLMKAAGLDPAKDVTRERLGVGESAAALKDKKIDAFFWSGGLPTGGVMELAASPGIKIKLISHDELVDSLVKQYGPLYVKTSVPANTYANTPEAKVSAVPNILAVRADMPDEVVYQITKLLFEGKNDLVATHAAAKELDPKIASVGAPAEYHPGAIKYYKEKGVWTGK